MTDAIIAMVGTRRRIPAVLADIESVLGTLNMETIIVTGDAPGVDLHVKRTCKHLGFRYIECHARWNIGPQAGPWTRRTCAERAARSRMRVRQIRNATTEVEGVKGR